MFKAILADTFLRLKYGDRFFYDLGLDEKTRFSLDQLQEIRKATMARILCDNTDIEEIQPQVFKAEDTSKRNRKTLCDDISAIPRVNINVF